MKQFLILLFSLNVLLPVTMEAYEDCDKISAYLGIQAIEISEDKAKKLGFENPYGSYISKVFENSVADQAGLRVFDYIYWVGRFVACHDRDLNTMLSHYETGDEVEIKYVRNGQLQSTMVRLGNEGNLQNNKSCNEKPFLGIKQNYRTQAPLDRGISVNVVPNSTAEAMGLEDDDIITGINQHPIFDWDDVTTAINDLKVGENIAVEFVRNGQTNVVTMPIQSYNDTTKSTPNDPSLYSDNGKYYEDDQETKEEREYGFLGVYTEAVSKEKAKKLGFDNPYGSYVTGIIPGTAAQKAGIQPFDYIYGVDQYRTGENQNLTDVFRKYEPNDKGVLQLVRNKRKQTLSVTFGRREDAGYDEKSKCEEPFFGIRHDHSRSIYIDGVAIEVINNSTAKQIGLENGDIITQINGHYIIDWKDIGIAIDNITVGHTITVAFSRDGRTMTKKGTIQSYCDTKPEYKDQDQVWNKSKEKENKKEYNDDEDEDEDEDEDDNTGFFNNEIIITQNNYGNSSDLNLSNITIRISDVSTGEASQLQQRYGQRMGSDLSLDHFKLVKNLDKNLFDLTFKLPARGETVVKIINEDGRVIYEYDLGQFSGNFSDHVDISQNGEGTYFLSVQSGLKTKTKKIILTKK